MDPTIPVKIVIAELVATAGFVRRFSPNTIKGTIRTPPPTSMRPERAPIMIPATSTRMVGILICV
jgi:hypothetical protein